MITKIMVDEGSAQIKLKQYGSDTAVYVQPSRVVTGHQPGTENTDTYISNHAYTIDGRELSVSFDAETPNNTATGREYQTSDDNLILVHDALRVCGYGGQDVEIIVTLPIGLFFGTKGFDKNLVEQKKANLMRTPENINGLLLANITKVSVVPEGLPVLYDVILSDDGTVKDEYADLNRILVVDIGGTSTDMALIDGEGSFLSQAGSHSAVFGLRKKLSQLIAGDPDIKTSHVAPRVMDGVLKSGKYGTSDVSHYIEKLSDEFASVITKDMHTFVKDLSSIDLVAIAGGGAATIGQAVGRDFGVTYVIPDDPDQSIVRGLCKNLAGQDTQ